MTRRLAAIASVVTVWLVAIIGFASPASAHSVSGVGATNWQTTLTSLSPAPAGLTVKVVENGSRLELTNRGPEIVVFGYEGEPYLRVGPKGVFINSRSPAAYLNCSRSGCTVPASADAHGEPRWEQFSAGQTVLWHDHRIHWMGQSLPPDVARDPGTRHVQARWTVTMAQGSTVITAAGDYTWIPGTAAFPWLVVAAAFAAVALVVVPTRSWRWLAVAAGVVTAVDFAHAVAVAWSWAGGSVFRVTQLFEGSSYQMPGWILGVLSVGLLFRGRPRGRQAAACAGASALLFTGLLDFPVLSRSQAPFNGSLAVDRLSVAACLGLGLGVLVAAVVLIGVDRPRIEYDTDDTDAVADDDDVQAVAALAGGRG
ncbi:MAG: hypothetical protein QOK39_2824 [Acidimicrobiaceae bacterium]|jgi:hypothetical protein|nr:hypothetical protein [Acidimicrobiaceae bacterium]